MLEDGVDCRADVLLVLARATEPITRAGTATRRKDASATFPTPEAAAAVLALTLALAGAVSSAGAGGASTSGLVMMEDVVQLNGASKYTVTY